MLVFRERSVPPKTLFGFWKELLLQVKRIKTTNKNEILEEIYNNCYRAGGSKELLKKHKRIIYQIGVILNISWIIDSVDMPVDIICHLNADCPKCEKLTKKRKKISWTNQIRKEILKHKK